ncbi:MAG: hypothetical protein DWI57_11770 [Chloroflexi bacterium]|nr:MAG: hypothetical protein DWI57_11770 [Chloroflexota bacterium]
MNSLIHAGMNIVLSQYEPENSDVEHRFIELLTFSSFDEIVELLDWIDARYWTEFPIWARNLIYRLTCLLEPQNIAIRDRAAMGLRSFGPDWDDEADRLETEAGRLRMNSKEIRYAH